jgi:hypothetical protein
MLQEITKWLGDEENMNSITDALDDFAEGLKDVDWSALIKAVGLFSEAVLTFVGWVSKLVGFGLNKNFGSDLKTAVDSMLPESLVRLFDALDIVTGIQPGNLNKTSHTVSYHVGAQYFIVPEAVAKNKRELGLYINAAMNQGKPSIEAVNQVNTGH